MTIDPRCHQHEEATIRAFVVRERQERFIYLLADSKRRRKFLKELGHFRWFDARFASAVPWKVDPTLSLWGRHTQGIESIRRLLKAKGAGQFCWAISHKREVDGQELELGAALEDLAGQSMGLILSCVPGRLAYFEGEEQSLLLSRPADPSNN
jgi:hypothetical protein